MWDFSLLEATRAVEKTMPFTTYRLFITISISAAFLLATLVSAGTGYGFGSVGDSPGFVAILFAIDGFMLCGFFVYLARPSFLYRVKTPHLELLVEYNQDRSLPSGHEQIRYAKEIVEQSFNDSATLSKFENKVKGVIQYFNRDRYGLVDVFSASISGSLAKYLNNIGATSLAFTDSTILGHRLANKTVNTWEAAQDGLVKFALDYKRIMQNALILALFTTLCTLAFFLLLLAPINDITRNIPAAVSGWGYVFALLFALSLKSAFLDPIVSAAMLQVFSKSTELKGIDEELAGELAEKSEDFKSIHNRVELAMRETIEETVDDPSKS